MATIWGKIERLQCGNRCHARHGPRGLADGSDIQSTDLDLRGPVRHTRAHSSFLSVTQAKLNPKVEAYLCIDALIVAPFRSRRYRHESNWNKTLGHRLLQLLLEQLTAFHVPVQI